MREKTEPALADDVSAIGRIGAVPSILELLCRLTGLRFAAVARVTDLRWIACAVHDQSEFGLMPGEELDVKTTICDDIRDSRTAVIIDNVTKHPHFVTHRAPRIYGFKSYISFPITRKDGSFFGTLCAFDPLPARLSDPAIIATFESFADLIAMQLDAQGEFLIQEAALSEAVQVTLVREQFIAILGHDLRNPVAAIEAGARLLERMQLGGRVDKIIGLMRQSTARISGLTHDLLDFAQGRLGAGLALDSRPTQELSKQLEQVVTELQIVHPDRVINTDITLHEPVTCDAARVTQLLSNLLGNALKHGDPEQPVSIRASTTEGRFTLAVSNGGVPIPPSAMPTLFQPFTRLANNGSKGLGLGLFIASEIAKAHGAALEVQSSVEETRFTLSMPCEQRDSPAASILI